MIALAENRELSAHPWEPTQSLVKITINQHGKIEERIPLPQFHDQYRVLDQLGMAIIDAQESCVKALATAEQLDRVRAMGFSVEVLLKDYTREFEEKGYRPIGEGPAWGFYHTYTQTRDSLKALAQRHPDICRVESLGLSVQGRVLWGIRISGNVAVQENEPRFRIVGNIHGNEHIGCEVALYMAYVLADSYGVSARITQLVNEHEVFILPMQNPDGVTANTRTNANGVNLNRDYGYMWEGWEGSSDFFSQPETRLIRQDEEAHEYAMSLDYHSGAVYICMPWGYSGVFPADETLFKRLAWGFHTFSGYDTITNFRWYQVCGVSHDAAYGTHGTLGLISEVWLSGGANNPPPESIEYVCRKNKEAVLYLIRKTGIGIHGVISDGITGDPVQALVRVGPLSHGQDWFLYSSSDNGDFHRPLLAGTYDLRISAPGYRDTVVSGIVVPDTMPDRRETPYSQVALERGDNHGAFRVVAVRQSDTTARINTSLTHWALGMPDTRSYSMSFGGRVILDMGAGNEILDGPGPDLAITENPDARDTIRVSVSANWNGPWTSLGTRAGSCSLDLAGSGISRARYVLVKDSGHGDNRSPTAGFDLDAVLALNHTTSKTENLLSGVDPVVLEVLPNPSSGAATIRYSLVKSGRVSLKLYDVTGKLVTTFASGYHTAGSHSITLTPTLSPKGRGGKAVHGIYLLRLQTADLSCCRKLIVK